MVGEKCTRTDLDITLDDQNRNVDITSNGGKLKMPQSLRKSEPDQNSPGPFKIDLAECRRYAIAKMAKDKGVEPNDDASD